MRVFPLLILGVWLIFPSALAAQAERHESAKTDVKPRTAIALFRYRGAVSGDESGAQFDAFRGLIEQKIENLRVRLEGTLTEPADASRFDYMEKLYVRHIDQEDNLRGIPQVLNWMKTESNVLQALRGSILRAPQGVYNIITRCHFIEDPSRDRMRVFSINLALTPEEFANTRDSHSLVILYSIAIEARRLAIEAKRLDVEREKIAIMVAEALNAIADLERRSGTLQSDMLEIKKAWQEFKNAL